VADDALVRMPGTQPNSGTNLEGPNRCLNCHDGYDPAVEVGSHWKGSMMAQAARDFLFWSCVAVAAQDSIWAVGRPNATDICLRCHFPKGWLEGRSDPTNASLMTGADFDGVFCDICHQMVDPFHEGTFAGTREGSDWVGYWDEAIDLSAVAGDTLSADRAVTALESFFNGNALYSSNWPVSAGWDENGAGQYFISRGTDKRASFADANPASHAPIYSRYHKSKFFCGTCHDVSNPVLANVAYAGTLPGDGTTVLTTEEDPANSYFHVERTFSEFMLSDYGLQGGAPGSGPFDPSVFETSLANNYVARCQDCHMPDGVGRGCDKNNVPIRPTGSTTHPQSGQPVHDLTGGNAWVPWVLASSVAGSPNYDAVNDALLHQGPSVLTLDLSAGEGLDPTTLLAGADRALANLGNTASIERLAYHPGSGTLAFRIRNHTGHKLGSGFPEGRRVFVNVKTYLEGALIREVNPYDAAAGTLKGLAGHTYFDPDGVLPAPAPLAASELHVDALVYEMKPSSTLTGEAKTFHFALGDGRYKDNRIPPQGFRIAEAAARESEPVWEGQSAPDLFTAAEYAGGWDDVSMNVGRGADRVEVRLYYQTTSREYIEFLRDEIDGSGGTLPGTGAGGDPAYLIQTDPWFSQLAAWGDTLWDLWAHNRDVAGAAPVLMAEASWTGVPVPALAPPGVAALVLCLLGAALAMLTWRRR